MEEIKLVKVKKSVWILGITMVFCLALNVFLYCMKPNWWSASGVPIAIVGLLVTYSNIRSTKKINEKIV